MLTETPTITNEQFVARLREVNLPSERVAVYLGHPPSTIRRWRSGQQLPSSNRERASIMWLLDVKERKIEGSNPKGPTHF